MKDYLAQLVGNATSPLQAHSLVREYLQVRLLASMQRAGAMVPLAFHGGTALRLLYALPRHSEDLDFALERTDSGYDLERYLDYARTDLDMEGYRIAMKVRTAKTVHSALVRFPGLPHELGLSAQRHEVLCIKIEVDTRPPVGAVLETTIVRRHVLLQLQHHDKASLLAGKLHAVLTRKYTKGRDIYDLLWYLAEKRWPEPNLAQLGNALAQTSWRGPLVRANNWRDIVAARLGSLSWSGVQSDVRPFLERPHELSLLTRDTLIQLLRQGR